MNLEEVIAYFKFDVSELEAKRNGRISKKKTKYSAGQDRVQPKKLSLTGSAVIFLAVLIGVGGAFAVAGNALDIGVVVSVIILGTL